MKYRGIFEYEYPTEHKTPVSIDVHLHGDCVKGKIIEWEYRPLEQEPTTKNDLAVEAPILHLEPDNCGNYVVQSIPVKLNITEIKKHQSDFSDLEQEPKTGYLSINDVMSVFDDFMRGDVDEEGTETFLEMLKDKAESEVEE